MVETIEIFNNTFECSRHNGLVEGGKEHAGHQAAKDDHDLAVSVFLSWSTLILWGGIFLGHGSPFS